MQFPFFGPHMAALFAPLSAVCERVEKIDHVLFGDRYLLGTVRLLLA